MCILTFKKRDSVLLHKSILISEDIYKQLQYIHIAKAMEQTYNLAISSLLFDNILNVGQDLSSEELWKMVRSIFCKV